MRPDEFNQALDLLPTPLHDRALALRAYVKPRHCETCRAVGDGVHLALAASHYDEFGSAAQLLDTAEQLAAEHHLVCRPDHQPGRGQVRRWAGTSAPLVAATDASWKGHAGGIGYVVSDGRYGLYDEPPAGMTVLLDSLPALNYLRRWQAGETNAMPDCYSLRPRKWSPQPTLVRLAEHAARRPDLSFQHVKGHAGHTLNEAADALSHMARRQVEEPFDMRARAHDLVDAFLRDWHATNAAVHA